MIVQLEEAKHELVGMRPDIEDLGQALRVEFLAAKAEELEQETLAPDFWSNSTNSSKILQTIKQYKDTVDGYKALVDRLEDAIALCEMSIEEEDESSLEEIHAELEAIKTEAEHKRIEVLMCGEYDNSTAIVSFHPGAGGTEAQDWCQMLYRMINRWAEGNGFKVKLLEWQDGDAAGLKSATITVEGPHAYGYLKSEHGVHRLVRVSPFDAAGRRQTSFASIEVMPEFPDLDEVELREDEYEFMAYHSSGAGGQNINKVSSAVRITHKATGIVVACQTQRDQFQNKENCMRMLRSKLVEIKEREHLEKISDIKGVQQKIEWGSQIRSYVFMPYTLAKDTRTGHENTNINSVMDGNLDGFINAYLTCAATGTWVTK